MKITQRSVILAACLALTGGFAVLDFVGNSGPYEAPSGQVEPAPVAGVPLSSPKDVAEAKSSANPLSAISLESLGEIVERPLFNPARARKAAVVEPVVDAPEPVAEKAKEEDFTLLGVLVTKDDQIALLKWKENDEVMRLKVGETFSDWTLKTIQPKEVVIESADATFLLKLFVRPIPPPAAKNADDPQNGDEQNGDPQNTQNISRL